MTTTLVTTYAGASTNSYLTVAEIRARAASLAAMAGFGVDQTGLLAASDSVVADAAAIAADRIDALPHIGLRYPGGQARAYPRIRAGQARWEWNAAGTVPEPVLNAQAAEVCALFTAPDDATTAVQDGVTRERINNQEVWYNLNAGDSPVGRISGPAYRILRAAGLIQGGNGSVRVGRG